MESDLQGLAARPATPLTASAHNPLDVEGASPERKTMYIGLGTILLILVVFLLFRALSGRRV